MKNSLFVNKIQVKKSPVHGYGVFAKKTIHKGEIIEECLAIPEDRSNGETGFLNYVVGFQETGAMLTGNGVIYNHSQRPNAYYDQEGNIFTFRAKHTIFRGQEIFTSYGKEWMGARDIPEVLLPTKWGIFHNPVTSKLLRLSGILGLGLAVYFGFTILNTYTFISHLKSYNVAANPQVPLNQRSSRMPNLPG